MESDGFQYTKSQWDEIANIVERAGKDDNVPDAVDKLVAKRPTFEKHMNEWKRDLETWNGRDFGKDLTPRYVQIENTSAKLKALLDEVDLARLMRNDFDWKVLTETEDGKQILASFSSTLDHIHRAAKNRAHQPRNEIEQRDALIDYVGYVWKRDLGLAWKHGPHSRMPKFIEAACRGVCDFGKKPLATISNSLRKMA